MSLKLLFFFSFLCIGHFVYSEEYISRLQNDAFPKSYSLKLVPDIDSERFHGEVAIFVELQQSLKHITLQSYNLDIQAVVLDNQVADFKLHTSNRSLQVNYHDQHYIDPGEHLLYFKFSGNFSDTGEGIYKTSIIYDNQTYYGIATLLADSTASRVFPCFDEPIYRSLFNIRLVKPDNSYRFLSNMPEIASYNTTDGIAVDYQTTLLMPTYLLAFVMTCYNSSEIYFEDNGREIPIRMYVHDRFRDQATFALEVAKTTMKFFTDYTNISYPLPKLDFVEVNLTCEGMENWGLVTIVNNKICYDESSLTSRFDHEVDLVVLISHEVSHMWFGNLVTHNWYNDLWLTEGIANYMENKGFKEVFKQEQLFSQIIRTNYETTFNDDEEMPSINTVVLFPNTYNEVKEQSGGIVYNKGSAILQMLEMVMGENFFRKGIQEYLKKHAYKSATTNDFISVMDNLVPNMRIRSFLESWLFQNRFPLISISEDEITNSFLLKQKNIYRDADSNEGALYGHKWNVPITYVTNDVNHTNSIVWFDKDMEYLSIPKTKWTKWIKLNNAGDGLYRVQYSVELYKNLVENFEDLDLPNRANLIDESFNMMSLEKISCGILFQLIMKIEDSSEYYAVIMNGNVIRSMAQQFRRADFQCQHQKLSNLTNSIRKRLYSKLSWNVAKSDNFIDRRMRIIILTLMCVVENPYDKCLADFYHIKRNNIEVHRDVQHIYDGMVKAGKRDAPKLQQLKTTCSNRGPKSESVSKYISECSKWVEENL